MIEEPEKITQKLNPGGMFRLVDVPNSIEMLDYASKSATFDIEVNDPLIDRNNNVFRIDISDGEAECTKTDHNPDFVADIDVISQIYIGHTSPSESVRLNKLEVNNETKLHEFDEIFPEDDVILTENF